MEMLMGSSNNTVLIIAATTITGLLVGAGIGISIERQRERKRINMFASEAQESSAIYGYGLRGFPENHNAELYWRGASDALFRLADPESGYNIFQASQNYLEMAPPPESHDFFGPDEPRFTSTRPLRPTLPRAV